MNNEWLTAKEVSEYLKVSLATVYRWTSEGILTKYKAGRTSRYKRAEVDEAMKAGQEGE
jgi:excisionase family DNA binding protein